MPGTLYIVSTPIGNLGDISPRALEVLASVDVIACEDTRQTGALLRHFGIRSRLISYHEHNEQQREAALLQMLSGGNNVALVSDAGTPCISDPGYRLVRAARLSGANVTAIPGPVSFVTAVVISGLPTDAIFFGGFLPAKKTQRQKKLADLKFLDATLVFFEAPHRLVSALEDAADVLGNRQAAAIRELTKVYEETITGDLNNIAAHFRNSKPRGEFVIVIDRPGKEIGDDIRIETSLRERFNALIEAGADKRTALKTAAKESGMSRAEAYRRLQVAYDEKQ